MLKAPPTPRTGFFLCLAAPLLACVICQAVDTRPPLLDRMVKLDFWGAGLNDVAREIRQQTGVDILFYRPDLPAEQNTENLYLVSGRVKLETVLQCLAKRYMFRFRVASPDRVELSKGYGWVDPKPVLRFQRLDRLAAATGGGAEEMRRFLGEFVKPLPLLGGDFSLLIEANPTPGNPTALRSVEVLPPVLADYLEKSVKCLEGEPGDYPPSSARPRNHLFATARQASANWEELLGRQIVLPASGEPRRVLREIAEQADIVIVLDSAPENAAIALSQPSPRVGIGRVTEELSSRHQLGSRTFQPWGAVFFEKGPQGDLKMDSRSRELFWDGLAVAGFDAGASVQAAGGADALLSAIKRDVFPELWRDPVCAMGYCPVTGRLAVVAPFNVMEAISAKLASSVKK